MASLRQIPGRMLGWVRDGWLIIGVTLLFFFLLNTAGTAAIRLYDRKVHGRGDQTGKLLHPDAGQPWFAEWESHNGARRLLSRFDLYRAWTMAPVALPGLNVDSTGLRATIQPPATSATPRRVLMLGGSVMWGYTVRDQATIPSLVAARLHAQGLSDVTVVNLAQPGYNMTQEVITLLLELRRGNIPKAVLFLDGVNDVAALAEYREPGRSISEAELAHRLQPGQSLWRRLVGDVAQASSLLQLLEARLGRWQSAQQPREPATLCGQLAGQYRNLAESVERLGAQYGFTPLFFWQPALATTRKPLTAWERSLEQREPYRLLYGPCTLAVDSIMAGREGAGYFPLDSIYDGDSTSIFLDEWGHVTEHGNEEMADRMTALLLPRLGPAR